mmetsp:Transcript_92757/g.298206  ORF Transcript_92757/g.298206 Transcript_92757/m.298206 type:complete len:217 (-) Transcript_92757:227-877(-)
MRARLMQLLYQLDEDGNGTISKDEFDQLVHIPEAITALNDLGVDISNLMALADVLFEDDSNEDDSIARKSRHEAPWRPGFDSAGTSPRSSLARSLTLDSTATPPTHGTSAAVSSGVPGAPGCSTPTPPAPEAPAEEEDEGKSMTFAEFLEMVIRLRSENQPSVADIVELRKLVCKSQESMHARIDRVHKGQADVQHMVRQVRAQLDTAMQLSRDYM